MNRASTFKAADAKRVARLYDALNEIPVLHKRLKAKPSANHDEIALEIQAADMAEGLSQGSEVYINIPADLADPILAEVEKVIREEIKAYGATP